MSARILVGNAVEMLATLPDRSVRCCVTSPPYFGLRDYGMAGQLGMEPTPEAFVAALVGVFREVRRVLTDDGTLWVNMGDSYAGNPAESPFRKQATNTGSVTGKAKEPGIVPEGCKPKDLIGIPWLLAFALRADGWYLRSDIIWHKQNPMPESVTDRPTKAHEYLFLLSKSAHYYYDASAIAEPVTSEQSKQALSFQRETKEVLIPGQTVTQHRLNRKQDGHGRRHAGFNARWDASDGNSRDTRNARSVWTINTQPYKGAHFATFPEELPRRCILAGSAHGDTVLDPFGGSGTTAAVAVGHGRNAVLIELNPDYARLAEQRIGPLLARTA